MKRLVYAPTIQAFIKSDDGVVDISPYIVRGSVNRKVNQVSAAQLTIRNPVSDKNNHSTGERTGKMLWTQHLRADGTEGARFHPMDPIIIVLTRLQGFPVEVFTGYIDKSPYLQLYPGLCTIEASCTLKRLLYTQWDAALPFVRYFLEQFGWVLNADSGIANPNAEQQTLKAEAGKLQGQFTDGSIGALLFAVLKEIGRWDDSTIFIEALPPQIKQIVLDLYQATSQEAAQGRDLFKGLIDQILSTNSIGTGAPSTGAPAAPFTGTLSGSASQMIFQYFTAAGMTKIAIAGLIGNAVQESSLNWNAPGGGMWQQISNFGSGAPAPLVQMSTMLGQIKASGTFAHMNAATTPAEAATIFMNEFEKPGIPALSNRIAGANAAFAAGF